MKYLWYSLIITAACLGITSCSTIVVSNFNDLSMLKLGMDTATVDRLFDDDNLRDKNTSFIPNTGYTVKTLRVLVNYVERSSTSFGKTTTRKYPVYNNFYLLFDRGRLAFWGFNYDYNMSENPEMRKAGDLMRGYIFKEGN